MGGGGRVTDDDMRRRPLDHHLECRPGQRAGGLPSQVALQVLALALGAHGVHVAADGRRVAADPLARARVG